MAVGELKDASGVPLGRPGARLGWKTTTHLTKGRLFVLGERGVSAEIEQRAADAAAAVARAWRDRH
ncbi:hypothetical protein [Streptomyces sp. P9-A2]|uniref:hypothetical protein n=1 Tax=Streptomyces sp. P9-A2 TaxID=3072284 RepID=UPI002FC973C0